MLSEGRKFGTAVTVAHQFLSQLEEDLADVLEGNVATTVTFRAGAADAAEIAKRIGSHVIADQCIGQPDLKAIVSRTRGIVLPWPHTLLIDHNERVRRRVGEDYERFTGAIRGRIIRQLVGPFRGLRPYEPDSPQSPKLGPSHRPEQLDSRLVDRFTRHEHRAGRQHEPYDKAVST
jgi:hypothetical protein